ncbi:hypothetical protein KRZ98_02910 [Sphingobium sp. AS12]|uniref:hypothetical protein n=1 Tax=Sphingobium sp. AS12 TaxID=2849495 RepID=UPI001C3167A5|nr:hypothetical protein [Sphingobium sp. AS12]MBV2147239.1 hypothetical protein [Sphingobium sp. AS12]
MIAALTRLIDREIAFMRGPVLSLLFGASPIAVMALVTGERPADGPVWALALAIGLAAVWTTFVFWRYIRFQVWEFKYLRNLGAIEKEELRKRHG